MQLHTAWLRQNPYVRLKYDVLTLHDNKLALSTKQQSLSFSTDVFGKPYQTTPV